MVILICELTVNQIISLNESVPISLYEFVILILTLPKKVNSKILFLQMRKLKWREIKRALLLITIIFLHSHPSPCSWKCCIQVLTCSVMSDSWPPYGLWPSRLLCPWNFPGKNTGVGFHFLLQGIFLI